MSSFQELDERIDTNLMPVRKEYGLANKLEAETVSFTLSKFRNTPSNTSKVVLLSWILLHEQKCEKENGFQGKFIHSARNHELTD